MGPLNNPNPTNPVQQQPKIKTRPNTQLVHINSNVSYPDPSTQIQLNLFKRNSAQPSGLSPLTYTPSMHTRLSIKQTYPTHESIWQHRWTEGGRAWKPSQPFSRFHLSDKVNLLEGILIGHLLSRCIKGRMVR